MGYATKDDIDDLYGVDLLVRIADRDRDGTPDADVVAKGLAAADAIIDAYLQTQYTLPLPAIPDVLKNCAIDIAVYKIPLERTSRTEEMRLRYEDALKLLDKIATGKVGLGLPATDTNGDGIVDPAKPVLKGRFINVGRA